MGWFFFYTGALVGMLMGVVLMGLFFISGERPEKRCPDSVLHLSRKP
jgi:hypothetical protein